MGYVCFENPDRFIKACACVLLPAGLVKFRNLVASELSLCMFHFLSSPLLGEICGVFGGVTCVDLFVLLVWEKLLVISMEAFVSPGLLVFHRTAVWFKSISVMLNIIAKLYFLSKL